MADVAYAIVGGGVIGRAVALALTGREPKDEVVVIERCPPDRVENQSTRNSGVVHAGIYYRRDQRPLKARLCVEGNALLYEFCREHKVACKKTGKLVVATDAREETYLEGILATARENDVPSPRLLSAAEVRKMEPNIRASAALYLPSSGIVDAAGYLTALGRGSSAHNLFATEVVAIAKSRDGFAVQTLCNGKRETFTATWVINASGSHADEIATMVDPGGDYALVPVRGEAAKFYSHRRPELGLGGRNIYPVPVGFYPSGEPALVTYDEFIRLLAEGEVTETTGVHLTPTFDEAGTIASTTTIGPAINAGHGKDNYGTDLYPPEHYYRAVSEFFPGLTPEDIELHQAGIQARMAGQLDWHLQAAPGHPRFINLLGIDSPGMTGSLAIARYVVKTLLAR